MAPFTGREIHPTCCLAMLRDACTAMLCPNWGFRWWPDLFDALIAAATTRGVKVRLLISLWAHTSTRQLAYLKQLAGTGTITVF